MKIPFSPSVYEHAARFVGRSPYEVSRDPELMYRGHRDAWLEYRHQPIVVGIDIYNLEAEAYGAAIEVPGGDEGIPAISEPVYSSLDDTRDIAPFNPARDGRIAMAISVARRLAGTLPEADVRIPVAGPFSIAFNLRGIRELCEEVALRPNDVARWLMRLAENQAVFCQAVAEAGLDVAFFESAAAPLLSPRLFHEVELPALKRVMEVTESIIGHPVPCIMGGNTFPILDDILATGTSYVVCNVETDQRAFVARVWETHPHVKVRINMDPGIVACDDVATIHREIDRILSIADGRDNCLMGTGCLPIETPPSNIRLIRDYLAN